MAAVPSDNRIVSGSGAALPEAEMTALCCHKPAVVRYPANEYRQRTSAPDRTTVFVGGLAICYQA